MPPWWLFCVGQGRRDDDAVTESTVVAEAATGSHVLRIKGYSQTKGRGHGKFVRSNTFIVGGHRWYIKFFPDGDKLQTADWVSVFLQRDDIDTGDAAVEVKVRFKFSVLDESGKPVPRLSRESGLCNFCCKNCLWGFSKFVERKALEGSRCLKGDCPRIRCDVTLPVDIRTEPPCSPMQFVVVPPSNMSQQFGHLVSSAVGRDVTFEVAGEMFPAHKYVLAARSSVFKAVFGHMREKAMDYIQIDDMEARVFKAMLHFIYTDAMPEIDKADEFAMAQQLLVAADMYGLERLKLICEDKLCNSIDTSSVASALALAEQHGCHGLKKACFKLLQSPSHLNAAMATDGFDHLISSCPSLTKELLGKIAACQ